MNTSCGREWTRKFTSDAFTASFLNKKYKEHREKVLFDQERALLPSTQIFVENQIKTEKLTEDLKKVKDEIRRLNSLKWDIEVSIRRLNNGSTNGSAEGERREFIKACPAENCRGFLSTQWKCGLCEQWACPSCHEIKGDTKDAEHTCNPDTVATVALLTQDTKNCPKCQTSIHRISGCDQMWCTQCHTAFNWRTNKIENVVHNPHYFEWLRRNGDAIPRQPGDNPCQNNLTHYTYIEIQGHIRGRHGSTEASKACEKRIQNVVQNTIHLRQIIIPRYAEVNYVTKNQALRIDFMRNKITEVEFKRTLQRNEKKNLKSAEIRNVLTVLSTTVTDIVLRFLDHLKNAEPGNFNETILEELKPIVSYANECFEDISDTYSSKALRFNNLICEVV